MRSLRNSAPVTLCIQMPNGNKVIIEKKGFDKIGDVKDAITRNEHAGVPRDHQILKIAGKPDLTLVDSCEISKYHKWTHTVLDMIVEIVSGEFYICVCYKIDGESSENIILKVNSFDTILKLKYMICAKLNIKPKYQRLKYEPEKCKPTYGEQHIYLVFELSNLFDTCTLEDHNMLLFRHLLKVRICFLRIKDDGIKHIYLVQISDDLDSEHCNPNECLLKVEYNTSVNKLYSMVAHHYKISVEHVVLMVNDDQIVSCDTELHVLFYPPIFLRDISEDIYVLQAGTSGGLFSDLPDCQSGKHCEFAKSIW